MPQVLALCAPVFMKVKPANLLMIQSQDAEIVESCSRKAGISLKKLYCVNKREMWLLYQKYELEQILRFLHGCPAAEYGAVLL